MRRNCSLPIINSQQKEDIETLDIESESIMKIIQNMKKNIEESEKNILKLTENVNERKINTKELGKSKCLILEEEKSNLDKNIKSLKSNEPEDNGLNSMNIITKLIEEIKEARHQLLELKKISLTQQLLHVRYSARHLDNIKPPLQ